MSRRKGERTAQMNERDYPHIVEMAVPPGGFGMTLNRMHEWHRDRGIESYRGRGRRGDDSDYVRWCFADAETAEAFKAAFGGQSVAAVRRR